MNVSSQLSALGLSLRALLVALLLLVAPACGKSDEGGSNAKPGEASGQGAAPTPEKAPETEEGLVEWVAKAIDQKSLDMLALAVGAEQMADFRREVERDPNGFWDRGNAWVANVKSGFSVAHRSDGSVKRWKALIKFGNGQSETVVFARVGGKLMFEKL